MAQSQGGIPAEVYANLGRVEGLLKRSDSDPRPVALMMCGVAGSGKSTNAKAVARLFPTFQRLSKDGILADLHGICDVDYPRSEYEKYQDEAEIVFQESVERILARGEMDIILDRSFYAKEDRDFYKALIEKHGGRWVLLYLPVPKDLLWRRICARRQAGVNADSALEISEELLDAYVDGFEVPDGQGETVFHSS